MKYINALNQDLTYINDNNYINEFFKYQLSRMGFSDGNNSDFTNITFDNSIVINYDREYFEENSSTCKYKLSYNYNRILSQYDKINFLDICYLDRTGEIYVTDKILSKNKGYIPMGICCIPTGFFYDNNNTDTINAPASPARFVSCYGSTTLKLSGINNFVSSLKSNDNTSIISRFKKYYIGQTGIYPIYNSNSDLILNDINSSTISIYIETNKKLNINDTYLQLDSTTYNISTSDYNKKINNSPFIIQYNNMENFSSFFNQNANINESNLYNKDYYGFENTYFLNDYLTSNNYSNILDLVNPCTSICEKNIWYAPSIVECIYLYMHIQEFKDIAAELNEEYGFDEYDMFRTNIDIYSSSIVWDYLLSNNNSIIPYISKYGQIKNDRFSEKTVNTYPMFQL